MIPALLKLLIHLVHILRLISETNYFPYRLKTDVNKQTLYCLIFMLHACKIWAASDFSLFCANKNTLRCLTLTKTNDLEHRIHLV